MSATIRSHPNIPDHEVLRKIGGGAYGEVWMARGVTGALRAVKVVWREDFEDERTFEREFEGILKFEPISRDHPGLVNILHVGRSPDGVSFYYYVMELGDDVHNGQDIIPAEYEARTLRADGKASERLDTAMCIDVGLRLAEALDHLHQCDLAHRDVKPSNVIFVNGKAKLADIGLVAAHGQRTFVGTEGFVPPEGPGSTGADVYSLGKVLYEIATGKDRLDFPELPDDLPTGLERKRWLELNRIICDVCEPRIGKRKISTARDLSSALGNLQRGKRRRRSGASLWLTTLILLSFAAWASWEGLKNSTLIPWAISPPKAEIAKGQLRVVTVPADAEVFAADGTLIGISPTPIGAIRAEVGSEVNFIIRKNGYRPLEISAVVTEEAILEPMLVYGELQNFSPPGLGEIWVDHLGVRYLPEGDEHVSSRYVNAKIWREFLEFSKGSPDTVDYMEVSEDGELTEIVLASHPEIVAFCDWLRGGGIEDGFLTSDHEVTARIENSFNDPSLSERARNEELKPFRIVVREYTYGGVQLTSEPPGADVYMNGSSVGSTSGTTLLIPKVKPGQVELVLVLEGYKPLRIEAHVRAAENLPLHVVLEKNEGVVFGKPWQNGIGMKFVPIDTDLMASIWETRIRDYDEFVKSTQYYSPSRPTFEQNPDHPVVLVSREDAKEFCKWLTQFDREHERIALSHEYRLPTDVEWSQMAGLNYELGEVPGQRDANKPMIYSWGTTWPPPNLHANYADAAAAELPGVSVERVIAGYSDGYSRTSPVGSFPANDLGLYDISGNVHEWVLDDMSSVGPNTLGILRGGGWNTYLKENLLLGWRNPVPPTYHGTANGFRIVLSRNITPSKEEAENISPNTNK